VTEAVENTQSAITHAGDAPVPSGALLRAIKRLGAGNRSRITVASFVDVRKITRKLWTLPDKVSLTRGRDRAIGAFCRDNAGGADVLRNGFECFAGRVKGVGQCRARLVKGVRGKGRQVGAHEGRPACRRAFAAL
jgi:hypothetical protein